MDQSSTCKNQQSITGASNHRDLDVQSTMKTKSGLYKKNRLNIPEKIVFVIDTVKEFSSSEFKLNTGQSYPPLYVLKRAIEIFIHHKQNFSNKHEFALATLNAEKVEWLCSFTGNIKTLLNILEIIEECTINSDKPYCDLQQVFNLIYEKEFQESVVTDHVVRIILLYSRNSIIPKFNLTDLIIQELVRNTNFFLDILYVHDIPSENNKCNEIFDELSKLDIKGHSYIMEASKNMAKVHNCMGRLLAHPNQRVSQSNIKYNIHPMILNMTDK